MKPDRDRQLEAIRRQRAAARKSIAKAERWALGALIAADNSAAATSRQGVALTHALIQARAQQYAADTVSRALNRIAAALEALAPEQEN